MKKYIKVLIFSICLLTLAGCSLSKNIIKTDRIDTTEEFLKAATESFIHLGGMEAEKRYVVIDITAFDTMPTGDYAEWLVETYEDDANEVIVLTGASKQKLEDSFGSGDDYDEVKIKLNLKENKTTLSNKEALEVHVSYPRINAIEGFEFEMNYKEGWYVDEMCSTYMS